MKAELVIRGGDRDGEKLPLPGHASVVFGRSPSCDMVFDCEEISRTHFAIEGKGSFFLLTDLQSSSGTTVNGKKVASKILHPGDRIIAGRLEFSFKIDEAKPERVGPGTQTRIMDSAKVPILFEHNFEDGAFSLKDGDEPETEDTTELLNRTRTALQTFYHVGNLIYTEESLDKVCHTIMDVAMEVLSPDRGFLVMYDPESKVLEPVVVRRKRTGGNGASRTSTRILRAVDDELLLCQSILRYCVRRGRSVISDAIEPETGDPNDKGIRSAMCVPLRTNKDIIGALYVDRVDDETPFHAHQLELLAALGRQAGVAIERARMLEDMEGLFYSCVRALVSSIEAKDQYTHGHSERVTAFAVTLAESMSLDTETLDNVRLGALLHDVGKIGVAEKILTKPSRLTPAEVKIIREHPARGSEILGHIRNIPGVIAAVRHHHEMFNGLGYPDGLAGEEIPKTARIVALADAFDAMTSNRSYRRNFDVEESMSEFMRCSGDQFDPEVSEVMIKLLRDGTIIPCNELFAKGIDVSKSIY